MIANIISVPSKSFAQLMEILNEFHYGTFDKLNEKGNVDDEAEERGDSFRVEFYDYNDIQNSFHFDARNLNEEGVRNHNAGEINADFQFRFISGFPSPVFVIPSLHYHLSKKSFGMKSSFR